ncbi:MAG: hypothetical protein RSF79_01940 [Janthinobacterium sp.]
MPWRQACGLIDKAALIRNAIERAHRSCATLASTACRAGAAG